MAKSSQQYRTVKLTRATAAALRRQESEFFAIFGRDHGKTDPVFPEYRYFYSEQDFRLETLRAMRAAKVRPEIIYVFLTTGYMPTSRSWKHVDQSAIEVALNEYKQRRRAGQDLEEMLSHRPLGERAFRQLRNAIIVLSHCLQRNSKRWFNLPQAIYWLSFLIIFMKNARATASLLDKNLSFESFPLIRICLESYVDFKFARRDNRFCEVLDALFGVENNTHHYVVSKEGH